MAHPWGGPRLVGRESVWLVYQSQRPQRLTADAPLFLRHTPLNSFAIEFRTSDTFFVALQNDYSNRPSRVPITPRTAPEGSRTMYDVIIIGGSYAGLAAALQLVRARRHVLIVDAGQRRNRFAHHSHGFLGQDGQPPEAIAAKGRSEVFAYPTGTWREALATEARSISDGFVVRAGSDEHRGKRLILATGVVDELPAIPGLAERWGKQIFFCPYCDGYEFGMGRLGVLATSEESIRF